MLWQVGVPPTGHIPSTDVPTPPTTTCVDSTVTRAKVGEVHALLAMDPGGTTGVGAMHVQLKPTVLETFAEGILSHKLVEVRGYWRDQADQLVEIADRFRDNATLDGVHDDNVHVIMENYLPDPRRMGAGATDLSPVWIGAAFCGAWHEEPIWQNPADKGYAKNDRLRRWGLWVVGSEHLRDVNRHIAFRVNKLVP